MILGTRIYSGNLIMFASSSPLMRKHEDLRSYLTMAGVCCQSASWEILPKQQGLFSLFPCQRVTVIIKLTFTPETHMQKEFALSPGHKIYTYIIGEGVLLGIYGFVSWHKNNWWLCTSWSAFSWPLILHKQQSKKMFLHHEGHFASSFQICDS